MEHRSIKIYDADSDDMQEISLRTALDNSGLFSRTTDEMKQTAELHSNQPAVEIVQCRCQALRERFSLNLVRKFSTDLPRLDGELRKNDQDSGWNGQHYRGCVLLKSDRQ